MRSFLIATASVACIAGGTAHAADTTHAADQMEVRRLSIAEVDFRDPASVKALYVRLHQAAMEACDSTSIGMGRSVDRNPECTAKALGEAIDRIDRPLLTAELQRHEAIRTARGY